MPQEQRDRSVIDTTRVLGLLLAVISQLRSCPDCLIDNLRVLKHVSVSIMVPILPSC